MKESVAVSYKRQHPILSFRPHSMAEWQRNDHSVAEWHRNDRNGVWMKESGDVSYCHSESFLHHSMDNLLLSLFVNSWMMTGWRNDGGMRDISEIIFFSLSENPSIPPHSVIPCHFRMTRNENHNGEISFLCHSTHFDFISSSFVILEWWRMTEWGEMKGYFWTKAKPLILKLTSFHSHSVILMSFQCNLRHF